MYGDNYFKPYNVLNDVIKLHVDNDANATLLLHSVKDPSRFGLVKINKRNEVLSIVEKPSLEEAKSFRTNHHYYSIAGLLILKKTIFDFSKKLIRE